MMFETPDDAKWNFVKIVPTVNKELEDRYVALSYKLGFFWEIWFKFLPWKQTATKITPK